jgi:hypothetical protein
MNETAEAVKGTGTTTASFHEAAEAAPREQSRAHSPWLEMSRSWMRNGESMCRAAYEDGHNDA